QRGRMIAVRTGRTFQSASQANEAMIRRWADEIDLVTDLVLRMTTTDAEIAATVHFSATVLHGRGVELATEHEVFREVMRWQQRRKPPLDEKKVADTIRHLAILDWIQVKASADLPVSSDFDDDDQLLAG